MTSTSSPSLFSCLKNHPPTENGVSFVLWSSLIPSSLLFDPPGCLKQTYEVLATPTTAPVVSVPTHFAKVILTARPFAIPSSSSSSSSSSRALVPAGAVEGKKEWSLAAFVLPNAVISDQTPLVNFLVPGLLISLLLIEWETDCWVWVCSGRSGEFSGFVTATG